MSEYKITSASYEELAECLEVIHTSFGENCKKYGLTKENYPSGGAFVMLDELVNLKKSGTHIYCAWVEGKIAGCVMLKRTAENSYQFTRFAVLPEYQHIGLGRCLIEHCKNKAKENGADKITLLMMYENEKLRSFYESVGFVLTQTFTDAQHPFKCAIYEYKV